MGGWPWQGHQRAHLEEGPPPRTLIPTRQLGAGWVSECTGPDASGPQRPHQGACRAVPTTECREKEKAPSPGLPGWQLSEISHGTPESQLAPHKCPGPTSPLTRGGQEGVHQAHPLPGPLGPCPLGFPTPTEPHTPGFSTSGHGLCGLRGWGDTLLLTLQGPAPRLAVSGLGSSRSLSGGEAASQEGQGLSPPSGPPAFCLRDRPLSLLLLGLV